MTYQLILFDADGVLFQSSAIVNKILNERYCLSIAEAEELWQEYPLLMRDQITADEFVDNFAAKHHLRPGEFTVKMLTDIYKADLKIMPGMDALVKKTVHESTFVTSVGHIRNVPYHSA